ncbi:hypothetical protein J4N42_07190 [Vibrio sp. SCSIO 43135]|uniref:Uncharacterized protein n=1 Tax=Vibrio paucivorans TaxID=2829489 RepID=A0A9X3HSW8_9VIBR|nr:MULTISPECIES: hypothetical protein [Vibrio]MCW8335173.1 hypothetical protein [Vibrio paucivorans]USD42490.1 hypothetical protein J4N42_07190 [Vibrio sp. SCSIO 43135]
MAAERLTTGRFVQIIIMLSILVGAFFWKTFTFQEEQIVTCSLKEECIFYVNENQIVARLESGTLSINNFPPEWRVNSSNARVKTEKNDRVVRFSYPEALKELPLQIELGDNKAVNVKIRF